MRLWRYQMVIRKSSAECNDIEDGTLNARTSDLRYGAQAHLCKSAEVFYYRVEYEDAH